MNQHWLLFDREGNLVKGCHCGFTAEESDSGYGDSVVAHLMATAWAEGWDHRSIYRDPPEATRNHDNPYLDAEAKA